MTTLIQALHGLNRAPEDCPLVQFDGQWRTWGEIRRHAVELDQQLRQLPAARTSEGEARRRIAVVLGNRPASVAALLATVGRGRLLIALNPLQPVPRLVAAALESAPDVVLAPVDLLDDPEFSEPLTTAGVTLMMLADCAGAAPVPAAGERAAEVEPEGAEASDVAIEVFTSGTTGTPKRIGLTFRQLEVSLAAALQHTRGIAAERPPLTGRPGIVALPMVHISGLWGVLQQLVEARPFVLLPRFSVDAWAAAVREHHLPFAGLPPAAIRAVLDADVPPAALSSLRAINSGTAALDPALAEAFTARYGVPVLSVYGATEFSGAVAGWSIADHRQFGAAKKGSVGRAFPGVALRTVAPDGTPTAADEVGQLEVRTPQAGAEHWVRTNDLARIDADGFLWIEGRADDVIVRGGFKITPGVVSAALLRHPAVRDAAVVGVPHERLGEVPVAAVELERDVPAPEAEELREFCRSELTPYEVPVAVVVVPSLPRGAALKVDRTALTALITEALEPATAPG